MYGVQDDSSEDEGMDDEAMARLEGGLAAAVQAAAASKPNSKERKQQMLNFKLRRVLALSSPVAAMMQTASQLRLGAAAWFVHQTPHPFCKLLHGCTSSTDAMMPGECAAECPGKHWSQPLPSLLCSRCSLHHPVHWCCAAGWRRCWRCT